MIQSTYGTQNRTGHPGYPSVQLRLTCDQIRTGSELLHVKYGAKDKKSVEIIGNHINIIGKQPALDFRHILCIVANTIQKVELGK